MNIKTIWILSFILCIGCSAALADNSNDKQSLTSASARAESAIQDSLSVEDLTSWIPYNDALAAAKSQQYDKATELIAPLLLRYKDKSSYNRNQVFKASWRLAKLIGLANPSLDPLPTIRAGLARRVPVTHLLDEMHKIKDHQDPTLIVLSSQDSHCTSCIGTEKPLTKFARESKRSGKKYNIFYVGSEPANEALLEPTKSLQALGLKEFPMYLVIYKGEYVYAWNGVVDKNFEYLLNNIDEIRKGAGQKQLVHTRQDTLLDFTHTKFKSYAVNRSQYKAMAFALNGDALLLHNSYDSKDQKTANQTALSLCKKEAILLNNPITCELYAEGNNIVNTNARERLEKIKAQQKEIRNAQQIVAANKKPNTNKNESSVNSISKSASKEKKQQASINDAALKSAIANYKKIKKESFKSFATTGTTTDSAFGSAINAPTQAAANTRALKQCQQSAISLAVTEPCLLHYIGNTQVENQDEQAISRLTLKTQRKDIKKSRLISSYSKYRRLSEDKAYAISHDDEDTLVYAMAFGKRGIDKASEIALAECEQKRVKKPLAQPCRLLIVNGDFQE